MCSENDRVVEVVDRVDDVDASLATLLSELIFGCTAAGAVNVELNKPKRPLPNAVDGIFGLQICSLKLCGSVVDRISAVFKSFFAGSWSENTRNWAAALSTARRGNRSPSAYKPNSHAPWPVTRSSPEWSPQASFVYNSPSIRAEGSGVM